uniref:Uncharacterized protein n=1 Tax=Moniliophthora roreri TaxID=221103 RepID=A0A0W0G7N6_MONRR
MTTFESVSKLRARTGSSILALNTRHQFFSEVEFDTSRIIIKGRLPTNVEVVSSGRLALILSGLTNASEVTITNLIQSEVVRHLRRYFCKNAAEIGVEDVSDVSVDEETGEVKLVLSFDSSREDSHKQVPFKVTLQAVYMQYVWTCPVVDLDDEAESNPTTVQSSPFSEQLSLPVKSLLDNVLNRFVTWHLTLSSHFWRYMEKGAHTITFPDAANQTAVIQQMAAETGYIKSIFTSLEGMLQISPNESFRRQCGEIIEELENEIEDSYSLSLRSLAEALDADVVEEDAKLDRKATFHITMENLYKKGMRRPQFKASADFPSATTDAIDDDELSHDHPLATPETEAGPDSQSISWDMAMITTPPLDGDDPDSDASSLEDDDLLTTYLIVDDVSSPDSQSLQLDLRVPGHGGNCQNSSPERSQTRAPSCDELHVAEVLSPAYLYSRDLFEDDLDTQFEVAAPQSSQLGLDLDDGPCLTFHECSPTEYLREETHPGLCSPQRNLSLFTEVSSLHRLSESREDSPTVPPSDFHDIYTIEDDILDFGPPDERLFPPNIPFTALDDMDIRLDVAAHNSVMYAVDDGRYDNENETEEHQLLELDNESGVETIPELAADGESDDDSFFYS